MSGTDLLHRDDATEVVAGLEPAGVLRLLGACVDRLADDGVGGLDDRALADHVADLDRLAGRLAAVGLEAVRAFDARGAWTAVSTAYSAANWLTAETGTSRSEAGGRVRLARATTDMPVAATALAAGEITVAHLRVLARAAEPRTRAAYLADEGMLVGHARSLTADRLATVVRYWQAHVDPDGPEPADDPSRDTASLGQSYNRRWQLRGDLSNEAGPAVYAALQEKVDELARADAAIRAVDPTDPRATRTAGHRLADALVELILVGSAAPGSTARRRPAFTVLIDATTAAHAATTIGNRAAPETSPPPWTPERVHELLNGTVISPATVALWLCDCELGRVVLGADGEPLDVGRLERSATPAQRRALAARDRGCRVPGCDRPAAWSDAHHIEWWEHGGGTDIDNLVLLCRHHHRRIHHKALHVHMVDHQPVFTLPDGTVLTDDRRTPTGREPPDPP